MVYTIYIILLFLLSTYISFVRSSFNLTLRHQHPDPEAVVREVRSKVNVSVSRRQMLGISSKDSSSSSCGTGNPIDDCWKCDPHWASNRQRLAECGIGFGKSAMGGKGGEFYTVTDSSDSDPVNPKPGTLRFAVLQEDPLWIIFSDDMTIKLRYELIITNFKTIDGRGADVHITGGGCLTLQYVSNIIIHNIHVHDCYPAGNAMIRSSATHVGFRSKSDGDGISISGSSNIWIDHCTLSNCRDGLIDAVLGSTAITISNNHFFKHNDVMLLGHNDESSLDVGMQVTIAFNYFGEGLVQRMPRCRRGYIHIVNNDFTFWEIYAVAGSANPTINSQGNRYIAPADQNAKEVTKRVDTDEKEWASWNWRTEGDIMVNGAFFVPSGDGLGIQYAKASSVEPKSGELVERLTSNAGVFGDPSHPTSQSDGSGSTTSSSSGGSGSGGDADGNFFGMIFGNDATPQPSSTIISLSLLIILILHTVTPTVLLYYQ